MDWVTLINTVCCVVMSGAATWACLSPKVHDRIVMKLGLVMLALGFAAHAWLVHDGIQVWDAVAMARAQLMINGGMVLVVLGWLLRGRSKHAPERRASDFVELDEGRAEARVKP